MGSGDDGGTVHASGRCLGYLEDIAMAQSGWRLVMLTLLLRVARKAYLRVKQTPRLLVFAVILALATLARAEPAVPLSLYHPFTVGVEPRWSSVSVTMNPDAWHVGQPDGPVASAAQLRSVLNSLQTFVVGCDCEGASAGQTYYPCGLEMARPMVNGKPRGEDEVHGGWRSTSGYTLMRVRAGIVRAMSAVGQVSGPSQVSLLSPSIQVNPGFLGLLAPEEFRKRAAGAQALSVDVRTVSSNLGPAKIKPSSGALIISTTESASTSSRAANGLRI